MLRPEVERALKQIKEKFTTFTELIEVLKHIGKTYILDGHNKLKAAAEINYEKALKKR